MNPYKKFIILTLFLPMPFLVIIVLFLYLYDPLQVYHKPYFRETTFFQLSGHSRWQSKGIIDFYDFDSIIMGSSMLMGTNVFEAESKLGGKWVNLTMPGSGLSDKKVVLHYALQHKALKDIIVSFDWFTETRDHDTSKFDYLYDDNPINDMKVYYDFKFVACALMWSKNPKCVGDQNDYRQIFREPSHITKQSVLDGAKEWFSKEYNQGVEKKILERLENLEKYPFNPIPHEIDYEKHKNYLYDNIIILAKNNPHTTFHLVIPAHTRMTYRLQVEVDDFYLYKNVLRYFVFLSKDISNIKIYGFDDLDYADNLGNYFDSTHYNDDMNSMQLDAIATQTHIVTSENIDAYLDTMEQKIYEYDIELPARIWKEIKESQ